MYNAKQSEENAIRHHGIKGMKWGVRNRRFIQNRFNPAERKKKRKAIQDSNKSLTRFKKSYQTRSTMSTQELSRAVERLRLENEFKKQITIGEGVKSHKVRDFIGAASQIKVPNEAGGQSALQQVVVKKMGQYAIKKGSEFASKRAMKK